MLSPLRHLLTNKNELIDFNQWLIKPIKQLLINQKFYTYTFQPFLTLCMSGVIIEDDWRKHILESNE